MLTFHAQLPASAFVMPTFFFKFSSVVILTAGTMFVMWLGEKITDKGIGNGISLIIMIGIVARMPANFIFEAGTRMNGAGGAIALIVEILFLFHSCSWNNSSCSGYTPCSGAVCQKDSWK